MQTMSKEPVTPVPAATIVMLRERSQLEIFMVVRHHQIDFASGALVFPGGKADPQDFDDNLAPYLHGADTDANMRAMQVAAIRESFEESGVLLARSKVEDRLIGAQRLKALSPYQKSLHSGEATMIDFLREEELVLACDQLHHFAQWVTPPMMPKRFDTHFFLAAAPEDHLAVHDGSENVDSVWINAGDAVAEARAGKRTVIFPTMRNLERLAKYGSIDAAFEDAAAQTIVPILPWTEKREDGNYICIEKNAGYDVTEEKLPEKMKV